MIKAFCGICKSTISIKESEMERSIDLRIAKTKESESEIQLIWYIDLYRDL